MADVAVNIKVNADVNALTAIKKELKEMKALALNGDGAAAKRVAELTDKLDDLKDSTKSLKGDGVERLQSSFGLLNESLRTGDLDKAKIAFKGIGTAMSAIPLLLLIEGLKALFDNFDKVVEIAKVFFGAFSTGEQTVKRLNKELEKQKEINKGLIAGLEDEIKLMEAQGVSSDKILAKKKEMNALKIKELEIDARLQLARIKEIVDNDSIYESYQRKSAAVLSSLGQEEKANQILRMLDKDKADRAKEAVAKVKEDIVNINHLKTQDRIDEINNIKSHEKKKIEVVREIADDNRKAEKEHREFLAKIAEEEEKKRQQSIKDSDDLFKELSKQQDEDDKIARDKKKKDKDDALKEDDLRQQRAFEIAKNYTQAASEVSAMFFDWQLRAAEGNEAKQLEIKKRAFNVEKAFKAVQAGIDTTAAVMKTYAGGGVLATPLAISMGVLGAANVAKILAARFNPGSAGAASSSTPRLDFSSGGGSNPAAQPIPQRSQDSTQFDESGNRVTKVVVLASDIKDVTRSVARVEEQAKF
jgi:hypothetical protein